MWNKFQQSERLFLDDICVWLQNEDFQSSKKIEKLWVQSSITSTRVCEECSQSGFQSMSNPLCIMIKFIQSE